MKVPSIGSQIALTIPEGVKTIGMNAFYGAPMKEMIFPATLKKIGVNAFRCCDSLSRIELKEGIETIDLGAFAECPKLLEIHLPNSLKSIASDAFASDGTLYPQSNTILYLSGKLATYLVNNNPYIGLPVIIAKEVVIDGMKYKSLEYYVENHEREEQIRRESEQRERQERERRERDERERRAAEERKKAERERINAEIYDLSQEMDSLKGLFAGMKRKKLQKRIDELNEQLRRL